MSNVDRSNLRLGLAKAVYHQSMVAMYLRCAKQFVFRYIEGIVIPPRSALTLGRAVDTAVTSNLTQKIASGEDQTLEQTLDVYSSSFDKEAPLTDWAGDSSGEIKDVGVKLVSLHHKEIAPKIDPQSVQTNFKIELGGEYDIGGTIDVIEKSGIVADTKTSKTKYSDDSVRGSLQAGVYDFAYEAIHGKKSPGFRYDVLIKPTKTLPARSQQVQGVVTEEERTFLFNTIDNVHKAIKAGIETPAPEDAWWCSKDWCGYWGMCKGKKK